MLLLALICAIKAFDTWPRHYDKLYYILYYVPTVWMLLCMKIHIQSCRAIQRMRWSTRQLPLSSSEETETYFYNPLYKFELLYGHIRTHMCHINCVLHPYIVLHCVWHPLVPIHLHSDFIYYSYRNVLASIVCNKASCTDWLMLGFAVMYN